MIRWSRNQDSSRRLFGARGKRREGGRTAAAQVELVRVHGLRERRERQRRAERHRDTKRASRARAGDPSRAPRRRLHRASGRSVSQVTPLASRVLNRVRVDDAAREDASPFDEARETVRKMPILPSASLAGDTRARVSNGGRGRATRGEKHARASEKIEGTVRYSRYAGMMDR